MVVLALFCMKTSAYKIAFVRERHAQEKGLYSPQRIWLVLENGARVQLWKQSSARQRDNEFFLFVSSLSMCVPAGLVHNGDF